MKGILSNWIYESSSENATSWGGAIKYCYLLDDHDVVALITAGIFKIGRLTLYITEDGGKSWRVVCRATVHYASMLRNRAEKILRGIYENRRGENGGQ